MRALAQETPAAPHALLLALLAAAALHAALVWGLLRSDRVYVRASTLPPLRATWHVQMRAAPAPPQPAPTVPKAAKQAPAPEPRRERPEPVRAPRPSQELPAPTPREAPETPAAPYDALAGERPRSGAAPARYLDAIQADNAPAPQDGVWLVDALAWPDGVPSVQARIWISASGRIERFELLGVARRHPALARVFARLASTPMIAARIGRVPVPSVVRVQFMPSAPGEPLNYVLPMPDGEE